MSRQKLWLSTFVEKSYLAAKVLYSLGLKEGDYIAFFLPNTTEYHYNVFGAWLCKATVSTGDPSLKQNSLAQQLEVIKPKIIICTASNRDAIRAALEQIDLAGVPKLLVLSLGGNASEDRTGNTYDLVRLLNEANTLPDIPEGLNNHFDPHGVCSIIWSSGTTGRPKGIQIENRQMQYWLKEEKAFSGIEYMVTTCFFHASGFSAPTTSLNSASSLIFFPIEALEGEDGTDKLFRAIHLSKPVCIMAGSHIVVRMREADEAQSASLDLSCLFSVIPIGSTVPEDSFECLKKKHFPKLMMVMNMYGQSEFGNVITMSSTPRFLGHVYPGTEVKIVDPETGETCGPNKIGEILARCDFVMKGYLDMPEENARVFAEDGFLRTGDLAHYDDELVLHYDGRRKEIIKFQNVHVPPFEVEEVIRKHPGVKDVGVFGRPHPTDQEHVAAAVVKKKGSSVDVTEEELKKMVQDQLELPKWLRGGVFFVDSLPRNPVGKLVRSKLLELTKEQQA